MELKELESAIEGILFAAGDPMPTERLCLVLEQDRELQVTRLVLDGVIRQPQEELYSAEPPRAVSASLRAVPYYAWGNRGPGGMRVWVPETFDALRTS